MRGELGMAKQKAKRRTTHRSTRKRASRAEEIDSLLIRSAESLGKIIGALQKHIREVLPATSDNARKTKKTSKKKTAARKTTARKRSPRK